MGTETLVLLALALIFGFYMAWNIGANDVANAMGTSVGSGALTLRRAVILAAIFEFAGALLVGANVSETVRKGIFDPNALNAVHMQQQLGTEERPDAAAMAAMEERAAHDEVLKKQLQDAKKSAALDLACGMIASLLAAGVWLQIASYFGWPVSTTHTIVGAVVGFGCVSVGASHIAWGEVGRIGTSWIISPLLAASLSYILFRLLLRRVFFKANPAAAAQHLAPYLAALVMIVMAGVTSFKALKPFWKQHWGWNPLDPQPLLITAMVALVGATLAFVITRVLVAKVRVTESTTDHSMLSGYLASSLAKATGHLRRVRQSAAGEFQERAEEALMRVEELFNEARAQQRQKGDRGEYREVERIFVYLQIMSACFVAFAHGSNDVANAIGPLSGALQALDDGYISAQASVPWWVLALGGAGIVIGLATWGWRVIETVGRRITELTPTRGFCAEFATAFTILLASVWGLPVSTTHTLVGAVLGVGLARGMSALNMRTMRDIVASWIVTIPAGAGITIGVYWIIKMSVGV